MKIDKIILTNLYSNNSNYKTSANSKSRSIENKSSNNSQMNKEIKVSNYPKYDNDFYKMEKKQINTKIESKANIGINFDIKL
jgi:hypothetical protein